MNDHIGNVSKIYSTLLKEESIKKFLGYFDLDVTEEHLIDTPKRIVAMYEELLSSVNLKEPENVTVFDNPNYNQMIISGGIPFYSLCSHHFLPFFGKAWIGYIPNKKIVGLSKLSRIFNFYSKKPQVQEKLTQEVAQFIFDKLNPEGVMIVVKARHLCTEMRGAKINQIMTTSAVLGSFREESETRQEFLSLIAEEVI